jgi:hypothetical protein
MILVSNTPGQDSGSRRLDKADRTVKYVKFTFTSAPKFTLQISAGYDYGVYKLSGNKAWYSRKTVSNSAVLILIAVIWLFYVQSL